MRVFVSGGVSIGNTTDAGANNLSVTGSASAASFIPTSATVPTNGLYLPAANSIGVSTNSTNAIYINSTQQVAIGTTSPLTTLTVASANTAVSSRGNLFVYTTNSQAADLGGQITFGGSFSTTQQSFFGSIAGRKTNSTEGNAAGYLQFSTRADGGANLERMRIFASGGVSIGSTTDAGAGSLLVNKVVSVGGATPTTSGAGITFPATQSASTDANTLDDYEEGTWAATVNTSNSDAVLTISSQTSTYTKIGRVVHFATYIIVDITSVGTGVLVIGGLPFTNGATLTAITNAHDTISGSTGQGFIGNSDNKIFFTNANSIVALPIAGTGVRYAMIAGTYFV
jgi:hypothetical protein